MLGVKTLTNPEVVDYLGLPKDIMDKLGVAQGEEFQAVKNQFLNEIINKICYQVVDKFGWENPFKKYDAFPVNYGDTIENIFVELPEGYEFDKDATNPFGKSKNKIKTSYATINYEMQYKITIEDALLRRAVLNEYGFMNIINSILQSMTTAKNVDEYFATIRSLNNPELFGNSDVDTTDPTAPVYSFAEIELDSEATASENAKVITEQIVDDYTKMLLPKTSMNALKVLNASNKDNLLLIIRRDVLNSINIDFLSGVFNLSKTELLSKIMIVDSFVTQYYDETQETTVQVGEELGYMIIDTRAFDNHVALQDGGLIYNPQGKYTNHFLNLWKIISFKRWYNAVAYKLVEKTPNNENTVD